MIKSFEDSTKERQALIVISRDDHMSAIDHEN